MNITKNHIVGEVVSKDYRSASIFRANKIDFCCKGNVTIEEVCQKNQINSEKLIGELNHMVSQANESTSNFGSWDLDLLTDYIVKKHHRYVAAKVPELKAYLNKIAKVHGSRHLELLKIEELFSASAYELLSHMQKEETILFPHIQKLVSTTDSTPPPFGSVQNPIQMMMHEHEVEGERFRIIAELTDDYTPPSDACATYKVAFSMLQEFEEDLHHHIHLENNILFPKAIQLEEKFAYVASH